MHPSRTGRGSAVAAGAGGGVGVGAGGTSGGGIRTSLVCAAGYGQEGALTVFSAGLRTEVVVDLAVPGATGVFSTSEGGSGQRGLQDTLVLVSSSSPLLAGGGGGRGVRAGYTRVLAFKEDLRVVELAEGEDNPFVCDAATVDVCAMAGGTVVQAHAQGVQDVLASEDPEMDGLGADLDVTVKRAAAAGVHACCLLSNSRLHLMALEEGDEGEADLLPVDIDGGEEGEGGGGVWEEVEAMCMFGVQEQRGTFPSAGAAPTPSHSSSPGLRTGENTSGDKSDGDGGGDGGGSGSPPRDGLFLREGSPVENVFPGAGFEEEEEEEEEEEGGGEEDTGGGVVDGGDDGGGGGGGGYASEDEEWATLYGAASGRSILDPCPGHLWRPPMETPTGGGEADSNTADLNAAESSAAELSAASGGDALTSYLVVCRRGGLLEVLTCEGRGKEAMTRPVFRTSGAALARSTLWNELLSRSETSAAGEGEEEEEEERDGGGGGGRGAHSLLNGGVRLAMDEEEEGGGGRQGHGGRDGSCSDECPSRNGEGVG
eukprot:jgi/Undpi1/4942/HiC_scaffold_19.g08294.m1